MSWFKTALTVTQLDPDLHFTIADQEEYYEWKFAGSVPKGTLFTRGLPPTDSFLIGKVIVSSRLEDSFLEKTPKGLALVNDTDADVKILIGNIDSPKELIEKYRQSIDTFSKGLKSFREDMSIRKFFFSKSEVPHLCRISHSNDDRVSFEVFEPIPDVLEKLTEKMNMLKSETYNKKGKAHEMANFMRFENIMTLFKNPDLHIDSTKMDYVLRTADVRSDKSRKLAWKEFYMEFSSQAEDMMSRIKKFESRRWVRQFIPRLT